jgi:hypothetical protein
MKKKAILFMLVLIFISTNALSQNFIQGQLLFTPWQVSVEVYRVSCGSDVLVDTYTTNSGGAGTYFGFGCLANGLYKVVPDNTSYVFSPKTGTVQIPQTRIQPLEFTLAAFLYVICGTVSGDVLEGVTITLSGDSSATKTTEANGQKKR